MKKVILASSMIAVLLTSCDKNKNEEPANDDNQTSATTNHDPCGQPTNHSR